MEHPLDGAWAKLQAAIEHFEALRDDIGAYLRSEPHTFAAEFDHRESCFRVISHVTRQPPLKIGTRVGDVVHNFASALDYTAFELAKLRAGREVELTSFPMYGSIRDYRRFRRRRTCWMRCLTVRDRAYLQRLQPYRGGDYACVHPLAQMYRLWNQDKHRVLHTTVAVLADYGLKITALRDIAWLGEIRGLLGPIEDGTEILRVDVGTDGPAPKVKLDNELTTHVAFEDGLLVEQTLANMGDWVQKIIQQVSTQFP